MTAKKAGNLFCIMVVFYFAASLAILYFRPWYALFRQPMVLLLASELATIYPVLVFAVLAPEPLGEIFPLRPVSLPTAFLSVFAIAGLYPVIILINLVTLSFTDNAVSSIAAFTDVLPMWQMILAVGVIGPLCEELAFRGYILQALRTSGRPAAAVLVSALLFGLIHMNFNQACYAFLFGLALSLLAVGTESLLPGLIMHMLMNSSQVLLLYLGLATGGAPGTQELRRQVVLLLPWAAGGLVLFLLLAFAMRLLEGKPDRRPETGDPGILGPGLVLGVFGAGGFILADLLKLLPI